MKERVSVTVKNELVEWLDSKIAEHRFANRSHGIEFLVARKMREEGGRPQGKKDGDTAEPPAVRRNTGT